MRIDFYHLMEISLDRFLPSLATNIVSSEKNAVIILKNDADVEKINDLLWTFKEDSFIPHGSKSDGNIKMQPIFLTTEIENPNGAKFMVYTIPMANLPDENVFERCFVVFNGKNKMELESARELWKKGASQKAEIHYWQDSPDGKWTEKT